LAPTGPLRATIDAGNPVLAGRESTGAPEGGSVDIAHEPARYLGMS
jgi:polar amino acid transport system substrate-binding protein